MWRVPAYPEDLDEVVELASAAGSQYAFSCRRMKDTPVDVSDDGNGCANVDDVGFAHEDLLCLLAYFAQQCLVQKLFPEQLLDARVEVKRSH